MSNQNYDETKLNSLVLNVLTQEQFDNLQEAEKKANELYLIKDVPEDKGIYYIEGNTGGTAGIWTGTHSSIKEYYPGLVIAYKIGTTASSSGTTLKINELDAIKVVRNSNTGISTAYPRNSIVILIYTKDGEDQYWKTADYDTNTTTIAQYHAQDDNVYPLLFKRTAGLSITSSEAGYTQFNNEIYVNPSSGTITANSFNGPATSAEKDGANNIIVDTYMTKNNPAGSGSFSMNRLENSNIGDYSYTEGLDNIASESYSHAEGYRNTAFGIASHIEGISFIALPSNVNSSSSNEEITNIWNNNDFSLAKGAYCHVEGRNCLGLGNSSHVEGGRNLSLGECAHAEGFGSSALGIYSHAEGMATIASGSFSHVQGKGNIEDSSEEYAHIVGNGDAENRSNAHTIDWNGNAWFAGDVYIGSRDGINKDVGSKKLATEEFVLSSIGTNEELATKQYVDNLIGAILEGAS